MINGDILQLLERHDRFGLALVDAGALGVATPDQVHTLDNNPAALVRELLRLANLGASVEAVVPRLGATGNALREALSLATATWPAEVP